MREGIGRPNRSREGSKTKRCSISRQVVSSSSRLRLERVTAQCVTRPLGSIVKMTETVPLTPASAALRG